MAKQEGYKSNILHLIEEFERIDLLIYLNISHIIEEKNNPIPVEEQKLGIPLWATKKLEHNRIKDKIAEHRGQIDQKIKNSLESAIDLRLVQLQQLFKLSSEEIDILLICLISEFDSYFQEVFSYLHNDHNKQYPSIHIILNLLSTTLGEKLRLKSYLNNEAKLFKYCLLECPESESYIKGIALNHTVRISSRIISFLLGEDAVIPVLSPIIKFLYFNQDIKTLYLSDDCKTQVKILKTAYHEKTSGESYIIALKGKSGSGHLTTAKGICQMLNLSMLIVNIEVLLSEHAKELPLILPLISRESILQNAAIYWNNVEALQAEGKNYNLDFFLQEFRQFQGIHFFPITAHQHFPFYQIKGNLLEFLISCPTISERYKLWQEIFPKLQEEDIIEIAQSFEFGCDQIYEIANHASAILTKDNAELSKDEVYKICHAYGNQYLSRYAKPTKSIYDLDNLVLPFECKEELEEIISWVKYKDVVLEKGGFNKKISLGKGLIALFFGSPGTGKTMAAEVIANSLNLLLYKIDLSSLVSKYIGETEKHLDKVFDDAQKSNAILFFDEADSLFGKRGEVKDATDNYANMQISYLLQKIDEYPKIVILATNLKHNMDEAFIRRLHFSIEFQLPNADQRYQIWQKIWPDNIRLDNSINLKKLADNLEIAGGNIRNIALASSFRAATEQKQDLPLVINKDHLMPAIKRELRKIGRIIIHDQLNKLFCE